MNKNQHGFALVEALIIFVIVAMLGGVGFYVWNNKKSTNSTNTNSATSAKITSYEQCIATSSSTLNKDVFPQTCTAKDGNKFTDPNPAEEWKEYISKGGKFTLKHPASWKADTCPNLLGEDI